MAFLLVGAAGAAADAAASTLASPAGLWKQAAAQCSEKGTPERPFAEWWSEFQAAPLAARDGAALRSRLRGGVPRELRAEVWLHVLLEAPTTLKAKEKTNETISVPQGHSVVAAFYGDATRSKGRDVTDIVKRLHAEGQDIRASNELFKDPVKGTEKILFVDVKDQPGEEKGLFCSEDVPEDVAKIIDVDVPRTFAHSQEFKDACSPDKLRSALRRFAAANADIGYVQSLNFIAGILVLVLGSEEHVPTAMGALIAVVRARRWYAEGMEQLRADALVLRDLLQENLTVIHGAFRTHDFEPLMVSPKWFLSLFSITLEGEALLRVWDAILADGIEAVYRVGLALFARREEDIVRANSIDEIATLFLVPQGEVPPDILLAAAYHKSLFGSGLDKAALEKRRCRALAKITSSDSSSPGGGIMAKGAMMPYLFARGTRDLMDAGRSQRGGSEGYRFGDMSRGIASKVESKIKDSGGRRAAAAAWTTGIASRLQSTLSGGIGGRPPAEAPAAEARRDSPPPDGAGTVGASPLIGAWRYGDCEVRIAQGGGGDLLFEERMAWGGRMSGVLRQEGDWHVGPATADGEDPVGTMRMRLDSDAGQLVASFRAAGESEWSEDTLASRVEERADC